VDPDLEIGASAKAKRLKFKHVPKTEVRFAAGGDDDTESRTVRENLPERVEPGVEYEDVRVAWNGSVEIEGRTQGRTRRES
jgi:hypothetical protein